MAREEAIAFLQEIKMNLEFLQTRYSQLQHTKEEQQRAKVRQELYAPQGRRGALVLRLLAQVQIPPCLLTLSPETTVAQKYKLSHKTSFYSSFCVWYVHLRE
jgi:hypothetical protein